MPATSSRFPAKTRIKRNDASRGSRSERNDRTLFESTNFAEGKDYPRGKRKVTKFRGRERQLNLSSLFLSVYMYLSCRYRVTTEEYKNIISDFERTLGKQIEEIQELRQCVNRREENLSVTTPDDSGNVSLETNNPTLRNVIVELEMLLQEERKKSERAEEIIKQLRTRSNEFERIARVRIIFHFPPSRVLLFLFNSVQR